MKNLKSTNRASATDRKRQAILRSPEIRRTLNRALFEIALKFEPCNLRVTFRDRENRSVVLQTFHDPNNILFGIPRIGQGELTIDLPDLPWIRKALLDTGGKFTLTELT
jgi:hypothetical protein